MQNKNREKRMREIKRRFEKLKYFQYVCPFSSPGKKNLNTGQKKTSLYVT